MKITVENAGTAFVVFVGGLVFAVIVFLAWAVHAQAQ